MTKYLDQNGLAYFWTKIKAWLSSHAPVKYFGQNWVEDTGNDYAIVVGNGVDENNPENVFAILNDGTIATFANDMDESVTPSASKFYSGISNYDSQGKERTVLHFLDSSSSAQGFELKTVRDVNGTTINNGLILGIESTGKRTVHVDDKNAWQRGLNPWYGVQVQHDTADLKKSNNDVNSTVYPSYLLQDKNGLIPAHFLAPIQPDGKTGFYIYGSNYDASGNPVASSGIRMLMDKSGNVEWLVGNNDKFRNALGASSGIWPISLGGSGMANTLYTTNKNDLITAASGIVIDELWAAKWGRVVWWRIDYHRTSAISVPANGNCTNFDIGTLKDGWKPVNVNILIQGGQVNGEQGHYWISGSNQAISCDGFMPSPNNSARTIGANARFCIYATYVITS